MMIRVFFYFILYLGIDKLMLIDFNSVMIANKAKKNYSIIEKKN